MSAKNFVEKVKDAKSLVVVSSLIFITGAASANEFTDRVQSASTITSSSLRNSTKENVDNYGFMIGLIFMVLGFILFGLGVFSIQSAARSEGRKSQTGGWVMVITGGVLGAAMAVFLAVTGIFSGFSS